MKVLASLALKGACLELARGKSIDTQWAGMADIRRRMLAGERTDVVIGSAGLIDDLIRAGRLDSRSRVDIAKCGVGAAVPSGAAKPDIGSLEALERALRAAKSIVYSSGPSGVYLAELFRRLRLDEVLEGKAVQAPPGVLVGELVARGEFELGFQQISELRQVAGIDYAGPLPAEIQLITMFAGAVHSQSSEARAGSDWLRHLASPQAQPVMRRHGLEPAA